MSDCAKMPDKTRCSLKICLEDQDGQIAEDCRKVEVKAFEPKKKKDKLLVNWGSDGSATFHHTCWNSLVKAAKGARAPVLELEDVERSMVLEANKTAEYHDADSTVSAEAARIATIFKNCKYCIAFTGAGISTAAGIGDFRGKDGKWTARDKAKNFGGKLSASSHKRTNMELLRPTYTHDALCKLMEMGILKFIISQNVDGLHRLSGIQGDKIAELHGNSFTELCETCGHLYELSHHYTKGPGANRSAQIKCPRCKIPHRTGRKCTQPGCLGYLKNTIINFGDYLESDILESAESHAQKSDVVLILGSSLKVSPANSLVMLGKEPHRLILCNRQTTPYDDDCRTQGDDGPLGSRVFCDCDKLMKSIMEQLLPPTDLQQWEAERDTRMAQYAMKRSSV